MEKLPTKQRDSNQRLITSTFNFHVNAFKKTEDGKFSKVILKSLKAIDNIKKIATKKTKVVKPIVYNVFEVPRTSKASDDQYKSLVKRLWPSPDEDSVQGLKTFPSKRMQ